MLIKIPFKITLLLLVSILSLFSCKKKLGADEIIRKSIEYSGGNLYKKSTIKFHFRKKNYKRENVNNVWSMQRTFNDSAAFIEDNYNPNNFTRTIDNVLVSVPDSMSIKYIESINSVFYFALLPHKLDDEAVISRLIGKEQIEETEYYKIKISFQEEGGGADHEDEFIYWFDIEDYSLDYLAYSFQVNGGGMRFRKAYNERFIKNIRFVDYENYKPIKERSHSLENLSNSLKNNELELLSMIELKNISVI